VEYNIYPDRSAKTVFRDGFRLVDIFVVGSERSKREDYITARPYVSNMAHDRPYVQYVLESSVRSDVLETVVDGPVETTGVLRRVDASDSAVYDAIAGLERRGLVVETENGWIPTGSGRLVADVRNRQRSVDDLLRRDDYWQTHDVTVLPERFRYRIDALSEAAVIEATDTNPHRVVREVARRIDAAEAPRIVAPVYVEEYGDSLPETERTHLLLDTALASELRSTLRTEDAFGGPVVRVADVDFALGVTNDGVFLSLPRLDGEYDARTEVVASDEAAIRWGRRLFDHYWSRAVEFETFDAERRP
jgi:predicted transcriptional regulator